jgi:hypothetical protein
MRGGGAGAQMWPAPQKHVVAGPRVGGWPCFVRHLILGARWQQVTVGSLFRDGKVPDGLGAECAMPASHAGNHECDRQGSTAL